MPQLIFDVDQVEKRKPEDELQSKVAYVHTEVLDQASGETQHTLMIPVQFHKYGVYPDIKKIGEIVEDTKLKREIYYRLRTYIKKLSPFLVPDSAE
ncbi:hypothetical protein [Salsuginibacillus halophilus]|nr:hypothetical protein [Salsuginibacillus halophilus]